jgi:hypothetical protein
MRDTSDPATDGAVYEASVRNNCVVSANKSNISISGVTTNKSNGDNTTGGGIRITATTNKSIFSLVNITANDHYSAAVLFRPSSAAVLDSIIITGLKAKNSDLDYDGTGGTLFFDGTAGTMTHVHTSHMKIRDSVSNFHGVNWNGIEHATSDYDSIIHSGSSGHNAENGSYDIVWNHAFQDSCSWGRTTTADGNGFGFGSLDVAPRGAPHDLTVKNSRILFARNAGVEVAATYPGVNTPNNITIGPGNYFEGNGDGGVRISNGTNVRIIGNVFYQPTAGHSITLYSAQPDSQLSGFIYNNTFLNSHWAHIYIGSGHATIENNIGLTCGTNFITQEDPDGAGALTGGFIDACDYNDWYSPGKDWVVNGANHTWEQFTSAPHNFEAHGYNANPNLTDNQLPAGSSLIDKALDIGQTIDYLGNGKSGAAWDIGAYEYQGAITPPDAPTNVSATKGAFSDKVTITWTKSTGATGYIIYANGDSIAVVGDVATYDDTSASPGIITPGVASTTFNATNVGLSITGASWSNGATRTYTVKSFNANGNSGASATDTGYRTCATLTYAWQVSSGTGDSGFGAIAGGTTATYTYTGAPSPTITPGTAAATDSVYTSIVALTLTGQSVANGATRYYYCAISAPGSVTQSTTHAAGHTATSISGYQWQRSAGDSDASYSNITGATTALYSDTGTTAGEGHYYKCLVDATGATQQGSTVDRGVRKIVAAATTKKRMGEIVNEIKSLLDNLLKEF